METAVPVDVLIVGSGPSGTSTALHLIKSDPSWASRITIVDKAVHPREKLCGGGVTHLGQNILARLGIPFEINNFPIREVRLKYEENTYSFFGNPVFRIVRRDEFDHWLLQYCESLGVTVRQGEAVTAVEPQDEHVVVTTEKATYHAQVVVAADGSRSFVRRALKWNAERPSAAPRVARLLEILTPENPQQQPEFRDKVAVFDFTPTADGLQGYYWDFPSMVNGRAMMNRGVFDSRARPEKPKADLKETLRTAMAVRDRDLDDYTLKGHPIHWWDAKAELAKPRVILVGDAAGADPLFGEGISFALGYGEVAEQAINDAFARQDFSFAHYRRIVHRHPLFVHLQIRTKLAEWAYLLQYPWLVRLGWRIARWVIKLTPWRNPDYNPGQLPEMRLTEI